MSEWEFNPPDLEDFFRYATISAYAASEDGAQIVLGTNLGGVFDVWGVRPEVGYPHQLSHMGQMVHDLHYDPQGRYILVSADHDGDENTQLYLLPPRGGSLKPLRTAPGHRHIVLHVSKDGNRIYYASDKENAMFMNNYRFHLDTGQEETLIVGAEGPTYIAQVSEDETWVVVLKMFSNTYVMGLFGKLGEDTMRPLVPDPSIPHVIYGAQFYKESTIFVTTNYQEEFSYLARYDIATGTLTKLIAQEREDLRDIQIDRKRNRLFIMGTGGVEDHLYMVDLDSDDWILQSWPLPVSVVANWSVTNDGVVYVLGQSEILPNNLYRAEPFHAWTPLTDNRSMGISPATATKATIVRYPSFDGTLIEALWFSPQADRRNGYTIIWPHGGPQAAERKQFRSVVQYLVSQGYQFFAPNFRGSTGYGKSFARLVEGDWGDGPRRDLIAGIEWLIEQRMVEPGHLFLLGGSYGGYMSLLLHGRHSEYFRAVVDLFGPSDLRTFYHSVPDSWKPVMNQFLGNPEENPEKFVEDSPITYVEYMTRPMLVIQGANDPRVVQHESDQLVDALRKRGRDIEYMVLPDEGHGFSKKENEIAVYRQIVDFLKRHQ
ncbi:S9 family peptidase [Sulfobacillus thermotolerans]|uniref:S9 family peptidase n=1 Tax=Sulfobacillus thermotolerans TaxID=338644 RepID=A0ABM6RPP1_9FIRM|nr:S9 family peptidase [Sulfobacillus thermotolerans]